MSETIQQIEKTEQQLANERQILEMAPVSLTNSLGLILRKFARSIELQAKAQRGYADMAGDKGEVFKIQAMHFDDIAKEMRDIAERTEDAFYGGDVEKKGLEAAIGEFARITAAPGNESMRNLDVVVLLGAGLMPAIRAYNRTVEAANA